MQHRERRLLTAGIAGLVEELYDLPSDAARNEVFDRRLDLLLDDFLRERQPVVRGEVTILLADIRGFTPLTRALPPDKLVEILNRFFSAMCEVVAAHGGVVDKFLGDAVLALFGVPEQRGDDLQRALTCAVEMQQLMLRMNREALRRGEQTLYAGIALNTGPVMMGSFGSALHSEYTAIGEPVNLASRIESFSLRGQVLLSEASRAAAQGLIETGGVNEVRVKGLSAPLRLHELRAVTAPVRIEVPRVELRRSPRIPVDLAAMFRQLEAKRLLPGGFIGHINDLGYYGMRADLPLGLPALTELAVTLRTCSSTAGPDQGNGQDADDDEVYARVVRSQARGDSFRTSLEFTSVDTPAHRRFKQIVDEALWRR